MGEVVVGEALVGVGDTLRSNIVKDLPDLRFILGLEGDAIRTLDLFPGRGHCRDGVQCRYLDGRVEFRHR